MHKDWVVGSKKYIARLYPAESSDKARSNRLKLTHRKSC